MVMVIVMVMIITTTTTTIKQSPATSPNIPNSPPGFPYHFPKLDVDFYSLGRITPGNPSTQPGWWFQHVSTHLKNMKVNWDDYSQSMEK